MGLLISQNQALTHFTVLLISVCLAILSEKLLIVL